MELVKNKTSAAQLRSQAEEQLNEFESEAEIPRNESDMLRLNHELQVHRVELEMQNAELRQARDEIEKSLEKYTELYDLAPIGYFTLDRNGDITAANFSGAALLGVERSRLIGRRFGQWVLAESRSAFSAFLETVYTSLGKEVCEVAFIRKGGSPLFVQIEAIDNASGQECRLALVDITDRKRTEESLRNYSQRVIMLEEEMRRKLAAELHDELGRDLTALGLNLAIISSALASDTRERLRDRIQDSSGMIEEMGRTIRDMMIRLRPPVLDDYGLVAALRWFADLFVQRTGILIDFQMEDSVPRLPDAVETAFYRITQEALANVTKHADAACVTLRLERCGGRVRLSISDDGRGFEPGLIKSMNPGIGWGLTLMRERAELVGGHFCLDAHPGQGTVVSVEIREVV